jgi:hypothetical protein
MKTIDKTRAVGKENGMRKPVTEALVQMSEHLSAPRVSDELRWISARYDTGPFSDGIAKVLKQMETDLSWEQHKGRSLQKQNA